MIVEELRKVAVDNLFTVGTFLIPMKDPHNQQIDQ